MPGATSVISSEACSCSCFLGLDACWSPGRLDTSVTPRRLPTNPVPPGRDVALVHCPLTLPGPGQRTMNTSGSAAGGELGPGADRLEHRAGGEAEVVVEAAADDLEAARHATDEPGRDRHAGLAGHVERGGERRRQVHQAELPAVDLAG